MQMLLSRCMRRHVPGYSAINTTCNLLFGRLEGEAGDPLLRADTAKRDRAQEDRTGETVQVATTEPPVDGHFNVKEEAESLEKATAVKQRLVRSVLCTRIAVPPVESVANRVLRAVLRGDAEALSEAAKKKRLKGVAVALTADDRNRTALHMAVATKNVRVVRALMQWRRELTHSLEDELVFLDHRRDMFIKRVVSSTSRDCRVDEKGGGVSREEVDRFEKWISEERRRVVRVTELQCEESWRRAMTVTDDKGRTPLHWAASVSGADEGLLQTLLTTGRANLSARDASNDRDMSVFEELKTKLRRAPLRRNPGTNTAGGRDVTAPPPSAEDKTVMHPMVFPVGGEFHRRTGKLRRRRRCRAKSTAGGTGKAKDPEDDQGRKCSDLHRGPDGLTAGTAKVKWFCGALRKTAEKLSRGGRGRAEAFLLSVFEDFDRRGDGTLSMRLFREALHDVNVRVSEQTLLEVGRYFQAPTLKPRCGRYFDHDSRYGTTHGSRDARIDGTLVEMSYIPLMDVVFGRKSVRQGTRGIPSDGENEVDGQPGEHEEKPAHDWLRQDDDLGKELDEQSEDDGRCYVSVDQIRAARVAVIEIADALGRSPLFLAAASGGVAAAKTLIRHGAASAVAVRGTGLTPYSVTPSPLMRRTLAEEARQSLYLALSKRARGDRFCKEAIMVEDEREEAPRPRRPQDEDGESLTTLNDAAKTDNTRRMEMWVSALAEEELVPRASQIRADQKSSLHLAAAAGLPGAIKDLLDRGAGGSKDEGKYNPAPRAWITSNKSSHDVLGGAQCLRAARASDNQSCSKGVKSLAALATDANGWTALHACCAGVSSQHRACALELLGSERDPNARTNTGKTPLHVAASVEYSPEVRDGGDLIPLLVSHGADIEACDGDGLRPIHVAAKTGRHVALIALLAAGADAWSLTPRKWNALHYSVAGGHLSTTRLLAFWDSDSGVFGRQTNSAGRTATDLTSTGAIRSATKTLWESAALGQVGKVARACLESSRSQKHTAGKPWACPGVNDKTPGLGFTPLHACVAGLAAVMRGKDISRPCRPPQPRGWNNGAPQLSLYARLARWHGKPGARHIRDDEGNSNPGHTSYTPMPDAAKDEDAYIRVCSTLLSAGADVQALDARCRTPLALAAAAGSAEVVEMLLRAGAHSRATDMDGNTPAHFAFAYANVEIGAVLAREGADFEACNQQGETPQGVAGLCADIAQGGSDIAQGESGASGGEGG